LKNPLERIFFQLPAYAVMKSGSGHIFYRFVAPALMQTRLKLLGQLLGPRGPDAHAQDRDVFVYFDNDQRAAAPGGRPALYACTREC